MGRFGVCVISYACFSSCWILGRSDSRDPFCMLTFLLLRFEGDLFRFPFSCFMEFLDFFFLLMLEMGMFWLIMNSIFFRKFLFSVNWHLEMIKTKKEKKSVG